MGKQLKTNAIRLLDTQKVHYRIHLYDHEDGAIDGVSVARKLGQEPGAVFKTLVTKPAGKDSCCVFVIPVAAELDLKKAARAVGEKSVSMLHLADLTRYTGYVRGGCSPLGMKKQYPTVFDESCLAWPAICVSGGRVGTQLEVDPRELIRLSRAVTAPLTAEGGE